MMTLSRYLSAALLAVAITASGAAAQEPGKQIPQSLTQSVTLSVQYQLSLPKDYGKDPNKKWPLLMFLHGAGESGDNVEKVKVHGPPKLLQQGKDLPFIVVSPQCPSVQEWWNVEKLNMLLDHVIKTYPVDVERVYLTGLSMGGYGTWEFASTYPHRFAAIAPICGGGVPYRMRALKGMGVWAFHGAKDEVVKLEESQRLVDALKAAGVDAKFTIYPEAGHDSWTETYNNPELYEWFLQHRRPQATQ